MLRGPVDKKFCNDYCRNNYNNLQKAKADQSSLVRNINNNAEGTGKYSKACFRIQKKQQKANRDKLRSASGFQFRYLTYIYYQNREDLLLLLYDYGYLPWIMTGFNSKEKGRLETALICFLIY